MIKIGKVSYLNTMPLFYRWEGSEVSFIEGSPSELVDLLRKGEIQAGIVSSIEYLMNGKDYLLVPNVCIASKERACSVLLFSKKPIEALESIYLTSESLTSKELALYVINHIYGGRPKIEKDKNRAEAIMLIGDKALKENLYRTWPYVYDLGEEWFKHHKLPFVFALFLVRKDAPQWLCSYIAEQCERSKAYFFENLYKGNISVEGFSQEFLLEYFTSCMKYDLDEEAITSLKLFNEFLINRAV